MRSSTVIVSGIAFVLCIAAALGVAGSQVGANEPAANAKAAGNASPNDDAQASQADGTGGGDATNSANTRTHKLQIGPWFAWKTSFDEPYINVVRTAQSDWNWGDIWPNDLYAMGALDPDTALPTRIPRKAQGLALRGLLAHTGHFVGEWVLEWEGDAEVWLGGPAMNKRKVGRNRIEFRRTVHHLGGVDINVRWIDEGGFKNLALYRKEYEALHKAGKIFNPKYLAEIAKYDVVRTMDLQEANRSFIRSIDQLATMETASWANIEYASSPGHLGDERRSWHKRRGVPLEVVFALAVETETELWAHAPLQLGAPRGLNEVAGDPQRLRAEIVERADEILASPEWDRYADAFVAALIASGYPADRVLYTTLDNEVWNSAGHYRASQQYANAIGIAATGADDYVWNEGYGRLMAKWARTLDAALERAGRTQNLVFVVESQTAWVRISETVLTQMKADIDAAGGDWSDYSSRSALGLTNYWGGGCWYEGLFPGINKHDNKALHAAFGEALAADPAALAARLKECEFSGSERIVGTLPWVMKNWEKHKAVGRSFGITQVHAYEGGCHSTRPSFMSDQHGRHGEALRAFYDEFMRDGDAAELNDKVMDALIAAFPGSVLANYAMTGVLGSQPWFDGFYGEETTMQASWARYDRVD